MSENTALDDRITRITERLATPLGTDPSYSEMLRVRDATTDAYELVKDNPVEASELAPPLATVIIDASVSSQSIGAQLFGIDAAVEQVQSYATQALAELDSTALTEQYTDTPSLETIVEALEASCWLDPASSDQKRVDETAFRALSALLVEDQMSVTVDIDDETLCRCVQLWDRIDPEENTHTAQAVIRLLAIVSQVSPDQLPQTEDAATVVKDAATSKYPQLHSWAFVVYATEVFSPPENAPTPDTPEDIVPILFNYVLTSPDPRLRDGAAQVLADFETLDLLSEEDVNTFVESLKISVTDDSRLAQWGAANALQALIDAGAISPATLTTALESFDLNIADTHAVSRRPVVELYQLLLEYDAVTPEHITELLESLNNLGNKDKKDKFYIAKLLTDVAASASLTTEHLSGLFDLLADVVLAYDTRAPVKVAASLRDVIKNVEIPPAYISTLLYLLEEIVNHTDKGNLVTSVLRNLLETKPPSDLSQHLSRIVALLLNTITNIGSGSGFATVEIPTAVEMLCTTRGDDSPIDDLLRGFQDIILGSEEYPERVITDCLGIIVDASPHHWDRVRSVVDSLVTAVTETNRQQRASALFTLASLLRSDAPFLNDTDTLITPLAKCAASPHTITREAAFDTLAALATAGHLSENTVAEFLPALQLGFRASHLDVRTSAVAAAESIARQNLLSNAEGLDLFRELLRIMIIEKPPSSRIGVMKTVRGYSRGAAPDAVLAIETLVCQGLVTSHDVVAIASEPTAKTEHLDIPDSDSVLEDWYTAATERIISTWNPETYEAVFQMLTAWGRKEVQPEQAWRHYLQQVIQSRRDIELKLEAIDLLTQLGATPADTD